MADTFRFIRLTHVGMYGGPNVDRRQGREVENRFYLRFRRLTEGYHGRFWFWVDDRFKIVIARDKTFLFRPKGGGDSSADYMSVWIWLTHVGMDMADTCRYGHG